jgi:acyl transferase domain-containing protein/NADPH:quinone reductase-like Zn-dependent oxidoreductase/acyl carrier protein
VTEPSLLVLPLDDTDDGHLRDRALAYEHDLRRAATDRRRAADLAGSAAGAAGTGHRRLVAVGETPDQVAAGLRAFARGEPSPDLYATRSTTGPVVFLIPGQGTQWPGMGARLLETVPAFREAVAVAAEAIERLAGWSPLAALRGDGPVGLDSGIDVIQPMLFTLQVGLAGLWRSWGVVPDAVIGHSMGEVAAAHIAGALTLEDAALIAVVRSRMLRKVGATGGGMAIVGRSYAAARSLVGDEPDVSIAASNGPESTVLTGALEPLRRIVERLSRADEFCRLIEVDAAAHSPRVSPVLPEMRSAVAGVVPRPTTVALYSTVTGALVAGEDLGPDYWTRNLREPVLFWPVIDSLPDLADRLFVELSPHPALLPAIQGSIGPDGPARCLATLRRDDGSHGLLRSLAALYAAGAPVRWSAAVPVATGTRAKVTGPVGEVLDGIALGPEQTAEDRPGCRVWTATLRPGAPAYVEDHEVQGAPVLPGTAYLDLICRLAAEQARGVELADVSFLRPLLLDSVHHLRCVRDDTGAGGTRLHVLARDGRTGGDWITHAEASISAGPPRTAGELPVSEARPACPHPVPVDEFYADLDRRGLRYGPRFRGIAQLWRGENAALGHVPARQPGFPHPARLDACLQVGLAATAPSPTAWMPYAIDRVRVLLARDDPEWSQAVWVQARGRTGDRELIVDVNLTSESGRLCLAVEGLRLRPATTERTAAGVGLADWAFSISWTPVPVPPVTGPGHWLVFAGAGLVEPVSAALADRGLAVTVVRPGPRNRPVTGGYEIDPTSASDHRWLVERHRDVAGVLHLWSLDRPTGPYAGTAHVLAAQDGGCRSLIYLIQALDAAGVTGRPIRVATRDAVAVTPDDRPQATHTTLWGLGRVIANERADLDLRLIDLDGTDLGGQIVAETGPGPETQVAWRGGERFGARLVPAGLGPPAPLPVGAAQVAAVAGTIELIAELPGNLDTVGPRWLASRRPGAGEVEIEVRAGGLNFADVMRAMGMLDGTRLPSLPLGMEACGVIVAVGPGVEGHKVGDRVLTIWDSTQGGLASRRIVDARLLARWPEPLSDVEAATLPGVFLTAEYALNRLARLQPGERVLIHSATGGLGLAAIQIAQQLGAEVLATAGSGRKREMLRSLGITHVMNSRTLDFVDEVRDVTEGRGVDVVLNSLSGNAINRGVETLAPFGRFLELGKRDVQQNRALGLELLRNNLTFAVVDIDQLVARRPAVAGELLRGIVDRFETGELYPLPVETYPVEEANEAVRKMARASHVGKMAVRFAPPATTATRVRPDATYLITGGLGGLGLLTAGVLVALGARRVQLVARRPPTDQSTRAIEALRAAGATVETYAVDVADTAAMRRVLSIVDPRAPLRGVVHAAGFLDDATLGRLTWPAFESVFGPKVGGAWNLHLLTQDAELDFFLLYSSAAAVLGTVGQGNYAAGNGFLDGLAAHRRAMGQPALSLNWGAWAAIGAVRTEIGDLLADRGLGAIPPLAGARWIASAINDPPPTSQLAVMPLRAELWAQAHPAAARSAFLGRLLPAAPTLDASSRTVVADARTTTDVVRAQIGRIVRLPPERVGLDDRITTLGVDSLMAVELRNALTAELNVTVPIRVLLKDPTVRELADHVRESGPGEVAPVAPAAAVVASVAEGSLAAPQPASVAGPGPAAWSTGRVQEARVGEASGPAGRWDAADLGALAGRLAEIDDAAIDALIAEVLGGEPDGGGPGGEPV